MMQVCYHCGGKVEKARNRPGKSQPLCLVCYSLSHQSNVLIDTVAALQHLWDNFTAARTPAFCRCLVVARELSAELEKEFQGRRMGSR